MSKLPKTKTGNYDKISERLKYLWYSSSDLYEFFTPEEIQAKLDLFLNELNIEDFGFQKYEIIRGENMQIFIITENQRYNLKVIDKIGNKLLSNFSFKNKMYKRNKVVEINFQRNYLSSLAHDIKPNTEKICNISLEKRGGRLLYMIMFDRYSDCEPFYDVVNGKYVPNEIGKEIQIVRGDEFGSANEGFLATDEGLKIAIETLIKYGYDVGFTNIIE